MEKEEITTNDYLKGIVLNHYLRWKGKKPEAQSLFLF